MAAGHDRMSLKARINDYIPYAQKLPARWDELVGVAGIVSRDADWMDKVVKPARRQEWKKVREQEAKQRVGHTLSGVNNPSYAFLGYLIDIIREKGHWKQFFEPVLGRRDEAFALLDILQTARRPVGHSRPLLPFEEDLISGIAGRIRNRVTIYLSDQDPDGDYYSRIERIEDSFGNAPRWLPGVGCPCTRAGCHRAHPDTAGSCRPGMCQRRHRRLGRGRGGRTRETDLTDPAADVDDAALLIQTQGTRQGVRDLRRGPRSRPCSMGDCPRNSSGRPVRGLARLRIAVTLEGVSWTAEWKGCAPAVGCHESMN